MTEKIAHSQREHRKVTVYTPESGLRSPGKLVADMFRDMISENCRDLAWRLFVRNISSQYRQSILGFVWIFLPPIVSAAVWIFLQSQKVVNFGETAVPYPVYVLTGNLIWMAFGKALLAPIQSVEREKAMLTKLNFPREAILGAGFLELLVNALVPMVILVPIFIWFKIMPTPLLVLAPFAILITLLAGYSLGLLVTPIGLFYKDVSRAIPIGTRLWFFLTPVIYPIPTEGLAATVVRLNPATPLLSTTRNLLTGQPPGLLSPFVIVSIVVTILLFGGLITYRLAMPHIVERMSA